MDEEYKWFEKCGNLILPKLLQNQPYFIFIATDTKEAQKKIRKNIW